MGKGLNISDIEVTIGVVELSFDVERKGRCPNLFMDTNLGVCVCTLYVITEH